MKKVLILLTFFCSSAIASYTPYGFSRLAIDAVLDEISILVSNDRGPIPWQGYSVKTIDLLSDSLVAVTVVNEWGDDQKEQKILHFKVTEEQCEFSSCGFEADLVQ